MDMRTFLKRAIPILEAVPTEHVAYGARNMCALEHIAVGFGLDLEQLHGTGSYGGALGLTPIAYDNSNPDWPQYPALDFIWSTNDCAGDDERKDLVLAAMRHRLENPQPADVLSENIPSQEPALSTHTTDIDCPRCDGEFEGEFEHTPAERGDLEYPGAPEDFKYIGVDECPYCEHVFTQQEMEHFEQREMDRWQQDGV